MPETGRFLAFNGRVLIGLVFAFATLWKLVLSPDYLDGTFFRVTLLIDERFEGFVRLAGGLTSELLEAHRNALHAHVHGTALAATSVPALPMRFFAVSQAATIGTLGLEAVAAIAFLWPSARGPSRYRDAILIFFCAITYAVATVEGFGWLLLAMGVAQCDPAQRATRSLYVAVFFLILLYREVPWASFLLAAIGADPPLS